MQSMVEGQAPSDTVGEKQPLHPALRARPPSPSAMGRINSAQEEGRRRTART
jgi:hypothetical protein